MDFFLNRNLNFLLLFLRLLSSFISRNGPFQLQRFNGDLRAVLRVSHLRVRSRLIRSDERLKCPFVIFVFFLSTKRYATRVQLYLSVITLLRVGVARFSLTSHLIRAILYTFLRARLMIFSNVSYVFATRVSVTRHVVSLVRRILILVTFHRPLRRLSRFLVVTTDGCFNLTSANNGLRFVEEVDFSRLSRRLMNGPILVLFNVGLSRRVLRPNALTPILLYLSHYLRVESHFFVLLVLRRMINVCHHVLIRILTESAIHVRFSWSVFHFVRPFRLEVTTNLPGANFNRRFFVVNVVANCMERDNEYLRRVDVVRLHLPRRRPTLFRRQVMFFLFLPNALFKVVTPSQFLEQLYFSKIRLSHFVTFLSHPIREASNFKLIFQLHASQMRRCRIKVTFLVTILRKGRHFIGQYFSIRVSVVTKVGDIVRTTYLNVLFHATEPGRESGRWYSCVMRAFLRFPFWHFGATFVTFAVGGGEAEAEVVGTPRNAFEEWREADPGARPGGPVTVLPGVVFLGSSMGEFAIV